MFRIKNAMETAESLEGECVLAYCHEKAKHEYDNIHNLVPVCDKHFEALKALSYRD